MSRSDWLPELAHPGREQDGMENGERKWVVAWFKVDDGFWAHPKTLALSPEAIALWVRVGAWSCQQLTDGLIKDHELPMFGAAASAAGELVEIGYWYRTPEGYEFHDWDDYQESSEKVKERRRKGAERLRKWREKQAGNDVTNGATNDSRNGAPDPTRPDPLSSNEERESTRKRAHSIGPDFTISDTMRTWAAEHVPLVDIDAKLPEFIDYWTGVGKAMKDWGAVWRNGMRMQQRFAERDGARPTSKADKNAAEYQRLYGGQDERARGVPAIDAGFS